MAEPATIRLQLRWLHQFQFAGYYAAIEQGYYRDAGLHVQLIEGGKGKNTINEVLAGNAEYGVTNAEILLQRLSGKPLVAVAAIFQRSPLVFITRKASGISVPQDLPYKTVKMSRSSRDIELQAMLHGEGIQLDQLTLLENVASYNDYFDPKIDALAAYITNQPYYLKEQGIPYTIISPSTYGIDFYGDCIFTTEKEAQQNPARVRAFRDATVKGWQYALAHTDELVNLIINKYKSQKNRAHLEYEAHEIKKLILADLVAIGHMNPGRWQHIAEVFQQFGLIPAKYSLDNFLFSYQQDQMPRWMYRLLLAFGTATLLISVAFVFLYFFNRRLQQEITTRKKAENALQISEEALQHYSRQIEQFSLSAASILCIRDEKQLLNEMSKAIIELSDFRRVLIFLFKESAPYRELVASAGISEETLTKIRMTHLPANWYDDVFSLGNKLGQMSYYIPHTIKSILNQEAIFYGEGPVPTDSKMWHPSDNLFVQMHNEKGDLIGVISVDTSKSGAKPCDETVRPLEVYSALISQIIVLKREYLRRQQLEQRLRFSQKLEALGNLTGGIAHDFNNILGIIIGNTELALLDAPQHAPLHHKLIEIRNACTRARDIVRHLVMFNQKSDSNLHPVLVNNLLLDSLKFLSTTIPPNIELVKRFDTPEEQHILADPPQFYQALLNLVNNAIQAMDGREGQLTITSGIENLQQPLNCSSGELPPGQYIRLQVIDTGHGIEPQIVEHIFDPYYTTREFSKRTGLGLSIVHGIIQSHNGGIVVTSQPERGTDFTIYLPVAIRETADTPSPAQLPPGGTETLLVVDDDKQLLEVTTLMLKNVGYRVISFQSPKKALGLLHSSSRDIDLLLSDITMPEIDGRQMAENALAIRPDLPIFLFTGYSENLDEQEATRIGICRYFEKPVDFVSLAQAIRHVLDNRQKG